MKKHYDDTVMKHWKDGGIPSLMEIFVDVERKDSVLERIEVNAATFKNFRMMGHSLVDMPTLREVKKGLFGRIWTAEIWLNNKLKDGQLNISTTLIEKVEEKEAEKKDV